MGKYKGETILGGKMRILISTADKNNNVSFYRVEQPLLRLGIEYDFMSGEFNTESIKNYDCVLITQAYANIHIYIAEKCKEFKVPLWLDYDDLLLDVSIWNKIYPIFADREAIRSDIKTLMSLSTFVTFSTNYLKNYFEVENSFVLRNAFDNEYFCEPSTIGKKNEVLHRGSDSHNLDLWTYRESILKAFSEIKNPYPFNWIPHFVGINPIYLNMQLNGLWTGWMDRTDYKYWLEKVCDSKIQIVPLVDTPFNRSKSNCAWIEGTYAGCASLVPNLEEWSNSGAITYHNKSDFSEKLKGMMSGRINLEEKVNKSREYINSNFSLKKINEQRAEIIKKFLTINN